MKIIILVYSVLLFASIAGAQTPPYDLNHATFVWTWTGTADGFNIKCGATTNVYSKITNVASATARSAPIVNAIAGQGTWFCKIFPYNNTASGPLEMVGGSSEISFFAAVAPSGSISFGIVP